MLAGPTSSSSLPYSAASTEAAAGVEPAGAALPAVAITTDSAKTQLAGIEPET